MPKAILLYDLPASDVITSDKKSMIVDSYVLWRVTDPLTFTQTLANSVYNAENRINALVYNATKNTVSSMTQDEIIKSRDGKMTVTAGEAETDVESNDLILDDSTEEVQIKSLTEEIMEQLGDYEQYGIEILAVEVKKLDLPDDNKQAVYTRMISERENIAAQYTAEGNPRLRLSATRQTRKCPLCFLRPMPRRNSWWLREKRNTCGSFRTPMRMRAAVNSIPLSAAWTQPGRAWPAVTTRH